MVETKPRITWKQVLILILSSIGLGISSCAGFWSVFSLNETTPLEAVFFCLFVISVIAFISGLTLLVIRAVKSSAPLLWKAPKPGQGEDKE
jgi:hypothetical protein